MELEWKRATHKRRPLSLPGGQEASDAETTLFHSALGNAGDAASNALRVACPTNGHKRSKQLPLLLIESQQARSANNTDTRWLERAKVTRGYFKHIYTCVAK